MTKARCVNISGFRGCYCLCW